MSVDRRSVAEQIELSGIRHARKMSLSTRASTHFYGLSAKYRKVLWREPRGRWESPLPVLHGEGPGA
jgi:hypothetical protein